MKVLPFSSNWRTAWDQFVAEAPNSMPFHRRIWSEILAQGYGFEDASLIVVGAADEVLGVMPLTYVIRPLGRPVLISSPQAVSAGPLATSPEGEAALLAAARALGQERRVDYVEVRRARGEGRSCADGWRRFGHYAGFTKELPGSVEEVDGFIPRKQRAEVRKARKDGISFTLDADLSRFYPIYAQNTHRLGSPVFPRAFAEALLAGFGADCGVLTAEFDGVPVASLLTLYHKDQALPYYAGGLSLGKGRTAYPALYAEAMAQAVRRGAKIYDFGRSIEGSGAYAFKRNFGFEPVPMGYQVALVQATAPPDLRPDNPSIKPVVALWKRMPAFLVNRLGPYLSRQVV